MHCAGDSRIWLPTHYSTSGMAREPHQVVTDVDTDKQRELQRVCVILNHLIPATTLILEFLHGMVKTVSLFSFSFSSLKISCMHTMCLGHLSLPQNPFSPPTHTYNTKSAFKLIYVFVYLFISHWVHLVSPIYTWAWGHWLEQGQPTDVRVPIEKQLSPHSNNHWLTTAPHLRMRHKKPPTPILAGIFYWLDLVQVDTSFLSPNEAKSCVSRGWHKTAFLHHSLFSDPFLPPPWYSQHSLSLIGKR